MSKLVFGVVGVVLAMIIGIVWFNPQSIFSDDIDESSTLGEEKIEQYINKVSELIEPHEVDLENSTDPKSIEHVEVTITRLNDSVDREITNKDSDSISEENLNELLIEIRSKRDTINNLVASFDYFSEERGYLEDAINALNLLEELIIDLNQK
ncbi:hypothetical protein CEY16_14395 [Halalkalibacillus sediminis]|uniref:Uncharacterized protein n=1 Tax=Halalkalibacillus sediminis TaxID=2018042 RepID=A0A2I0QQE0_9BACI|nr:hypothetical protein [Halalkalibacillus sediminis]PKR76546.1 hypothetical protein CEY16_14395 [Halalkalibacillus sediminis]